MDEQEAGVVGVEREGKRLRAARRHLVQHAHRLFWCATRSTRKAEFGEPRPAKAVGGADEDDAVPIGDDQEGRIRTKAQVGLTLHHLGRTLVRVRVHDAHTEEADKVDVSRRLLGHAFNLPRAESRYWAPAHARCWQRAATACFVPAPMARACVGALRAQPAKTSGDGRPTRICNPCPNPPPTPCPTFWT